MKIIPAPINVLVTLDTYYLPQLKVMLSSLLDHNPGQEFCVFLLHSSIREEDLAPVRRLLGKQGELIPIQMDASALANAPTTARYPAEMYYRIFAAQYLPDTVDRVLYLDPDVVVNGPVDKLYRMQMKGYYYAAASHVGDLLRRFNGRRLDMEDESPYINSGVMLMNLTLLRREQDPHEVYRFIEQYKNVLMLPDQDIISSLYGTKILELSPFRYNMTEVLFQQHKPFEKGFGLDWVRQNSVIIHYCGRNKPWRTPYIGELDLFYREAAARLRDKTTP